MLEITRAYAQGHLFESHEYDEAAQAHVHFFMVFARRLEAMLEALPVVEWQELVMIDAQNFRASLSLALDAGDVESAAAVCEALHYWLWEHGSAHASDLTSRIATILATTMESAVEAPLRLTYAGLLRRTDRPRALEAAKRAYELYRAEGDAYHIADALRCMGSLQHDVLGAPAAKMAGDMERYADIMLGQGSTLRSAELLNNLGVSYAQMLDDARLQDALLCFERAAGLLEARGDRERAGRVIGNSAATAYLLGDVELAAHWAGRAVGFFDGQHDAMGAGHQWSNYGFYLCMVGRYDEAKAALERGLEMAKSLSDRVGVSGVFEYASHYYHLTGNDPFAAQLIGASEVLMPPDVASQARAAAVMQELIAALKESLGEDLYEQNRKRGLAMPLDEVMREACLP
jgi:tetratricopeptide (TPR) repeat protein